MQQLLLLVAFLLPAGAGAGEIIGGQEALPHSHPYMAYLLTRTPRGLSTCGGFLVREDFVMTSARCWGSRMHVILGAHNIRRLERTQQRISVLRAIRHPRYNQQNHLNDLMLLQLENRARQNRFVRPVALPQSQTRLHPGSLCTVAGWGLVSQNRRTDTLRDVQLTVQRDQECSNYFDTFNGRRQICVGDEIEGKTTFLGDTGGPLVCNNVAQGIVSYGRRFGAPPTVFTRIARFLPWINRTMNQLNQKRAHRDLSSPCN
uniref:Cathepsin G n=1 Tax=Pipistrellus kuhlii TaxID=59472 RepID=A0A7J8AZ19_PIPKU|nr:cathepsin G [Pipistrellus kuhlii]